MSGDYEISFIAFQFATVSIGDESQDNSTDFVIGIDFGTTFTGVAFAYSEDTTGNDLKKIADDLEVVKTWPNIGSVEKIPTMIAYPPNAGTQWGFSVRHNSEPQVSYFKLGLQPGMVDHYSNKASSALPFLEPNYKHPKLPNKSAVDFAADYLTCVHKYLMDVYFKNKFGDQFLRDQKISYVITVPAIWKDSAKDLTRQAAVRAGIPANRLELITEPEAAALYCATVHQKVDLRDGDCFLICDAGGGTVV
jgi:molecular chaperone DnaK (HSP70)